jgi:hypothetical protein
VLPQGEPSAQELGQVLQPRPGAVLRPVHSGKRGTAGRPPPGALRRCLPRRLTP